MVPFLLCICWEIPPFQHPPTWKEAFAGLQHLLPCCCSYIPFSYPLGSKRQSGRSGRFISERLHLSHPLKHCLLVSGKEKAASPSQKKHFYLGFSLYHILGKCCSFVTIMVFCKTSNLDGVLHCGLLCYSMQLHGPDSLQHTGCFTLSKWCKTDGST